MSEENTTLKTLISKMGNGDSFIPFVNSVLSGDFEGAQNVIEQEYVKTKLEEQKKQLQSEEGYIKTREELISNLKEVIKIKQTLPFYRYLFDIKEEELEE
jgi:hypothetical protein